MGCAASAIAGGNILEKADGGKEAFDARFTEDRVLGEGEFGQVKLVIETLAGGQEKPKAMYACKTLRKGPVFKDNTLYPPLPADLLRGEIDMLRTLAGQHYNMKLIAVYETPRTILMVTDFYTGGEMMEYISKQPEDLRTEDVSRISFQLLDAVHFCATNNIIHRDIKPENIMFVSPESSAELRLIDFGSGTNKVVDGMHTTFAGTPFYNSPEMFQKTYTTKTDVFSCGVVFYVLVAGYPSECLQKAFNILLDAKRKTLATLPNLPENMPDSYYELLEECLKYRHKGRKSAGEIIETCDFVKFHKDLAAEESGEAEEKDSFPTDEGAPATKKASPRKSRMERTPSFAIHGTVKRHSAFMNFKGHERSMTTIIATMLSKNEFAKLLTILEERYAGRESENPQLQVVSVKELKDIVRVEIDNDACVGIIDQLPQSATYDGFSYHISMLKEFIPREEVNAAAAAPQRNVGTFQKRGSVWEDKGSKNFTKTTTNNNAAAIAQSLSYEDQIDIGQTMHHGKSAAPLPDRKMNKARSVFIF